jgi:hypothetical protein
VFRKSLESLFCERPDQREVTVKGIHLIQEDSPNDWNQVSRSMIKVSAGSL